MTVPLIVIRHQALNPAIPSDPGDHSCYLAEDAGFATEYANKLNAAHKDMKYWVEYISAEVVTNEYPRCMVAIIPGKSGTIVVQDSEHLRLSEERLGKR